MLCRYKITTLIPYWSIWRKKIVLHHQINGWPLQLCPVLLCIHGKYIKLHWHIHIANITKHCRQSTTGNNHDTLKQQSHSTRRITQDATRVYPKKQIEKKLQFRSVERATQLFIVMINGCIQLLFTNRLPRADLIHSMPINRYHKSQTFFFVTIEVLRCWAVELLLFGLHTNEEKKRWIYKVVDCSWTNSIELSETECDCCCLLVYFRMVSKK